MRKLLVRICDSIGWCLMELGLLIDIDMTAKDNMINVIRCYLAGQLWQMGNWFYSKSFKLLDNEESTSNR
jgi:hypothetical protein